MSAVGSSEAKRAWLAEVLGVVLPAAGVAPGPKATASAAAGKAAADVAETAAESFEKGVANGRTVTVKPADPTSPVSQAARRPEAWSRMVGAALRAPAAVAAPIEPAAPTGAKASFVAKSGKKLSVVTGKDGRVSFTADPPSVREVTFSGGGGKGAALPGAVKALEETGVLDEVKVFHGASVGSMTAAVLAAGMSSETFTKIGNDTKMGPIVKGGSLLPINVDGEKFEGFVREQLGLSVRGRIAAYLKDAGEGADPASLEAARAIDGKLARGGGVTFGDLRTLSKFVPGIKDLAISGTMMGDDSGKPGAIAKGKPQLAIFSADTEPDLDVARAVHASAALPPVFKPVDIRLSSGVTARFEDGGVMNNAPTSDLIGAERQLDPVPDAGKMTFVFQSEESDELLGGTATPTRSRIGDFIAKAPLSATEYGERRGLADRPEEIIEVPLKFKGPWYKRTDFSGFIGGTVNFDIPKDARLKLQGMTEDATLAHVRNRQLPETRQFASPGEMLSAVGRSDLEAMAEAGYPGAKDELVFRDAVADGIAALTAIASGAKAAALKQGPVQAALKKLDDLAKGDINRLAYIGRELNRSGRLDPLLDLAKKSGEHGIAALDAGVVVADALAAKSHAQTILRDVIYPKMVTEKPKSANGTVLRLVDNMLRSARTPSEVNAALDNAIRHFAKASDFANRHGHRAFAAELKRYLMPV